MVRMGEDSCMTRYTQWGAKITDPWIGGWVQLGHATAPLMAAAGFDWIALDAQHGLFDRDGVVRAIRDCAPVDVFVRTPSNDPVWIGLALDAGARGVIVPLVDTAEDAARAVAACRYPPDGGRSWGQFGRLRGDGGDEPPEDANRRVVCAVMVETAAGLANADAIARVAGVDMIFVGPFDLSLALGSTVPATMRAGVDGPLGVIYRACAAADVLPGAFAGVPERTGALLDCGFRVIAVATDAGLLAGASTAARATALGSHRVSAGVPDP
jgi:4-hydroxy-2-oxoheptanedioate aldolase